MRSTRTVDDMIFSKLIEPDVRMCGVINDLV